MAEQKKFRRKKDMRNCPDCGTFPNDWHDDGCDVERCGICGRQRLSCECPKDCRVARIKWDGYSAYSYEKQQCRVLGYWIRFEGSHWVPCESTDVGAVEDITRYMWESAWNRRTRRWERKEPK